MRVSRREFMGLAAAGTIGALSIGALSGCSPNTSQAEEDDQEAGTTTKAEVPTDGVYLTKAKGHDNWIYVATTMRDGAIAACSVVRHDETIGVGNYACARIPAAIVANQSVNVPNVYGCSVSSRAIKDAVAEAITLSGYNLEDFSAEITIEQTN